MNTQYLLFETRRIVRNKRVMIFSIVMPVVLLLLIGGQLRNTDFGNGISGAAYYMVSMAVFGALGGAMGSGGGIAVERGLGWNRTLRLSPLRPTSYVGTKILLAMLMVIPPLSATFLVGGLFLGVHLSAGQWLIAYAVTWVGALPFAAVGLIIGYVATPDSMQPITALLNVGFAFLGGLWFPTSGGPRWMQIVSELTPAYWSAQTSRSTLTGFGVDAKGLAVVLGWTVVLGAIGLTRFRADTKRA